MFTGVAPRGAFKGPPAKHRVSYVTFIPLTGHRRTGSETLLKLSVPPLSCACVWRFVWGLFLVVFRCFGDLVLVDKHPKLKNSRLLACLRDIKTQPTECPES